MLQKLAIRNYAIIDALDIEFSEHLNIITGETGAGKSIIVGALGLILGERADTGVLVNKEMKLVVEGFFNISDKKAVKGYLQANEWDVDDELVVRREIATSGKSRAFINDTPVNLSQLQSLSRLLVDLHQQFDTMNVGEKDFQLQVVDALAQTGEALKKYRLTYLEWQAEKQAYEKLMAEKIQFEKEADYHRFQYNELEEAHFKSGELEQIDADLKMMTHAEGIKLALDKTYAQLEEGEMPVVPLIKSFVQQLNSFAGYHKEVAAVVERLQSVQIELKDIAGEISSISDSVVFDPQQMEQMNDRLSLGYKLQKKHGVSTTDELLAIQAQLEEKLQAVLHIDDTIAKYEKQIKALQADLEKQAEAISVARKKPIAAFEKNMKQLLTQVGMPNACVKVQLTDTALTITGKDEIVFLFDANVPPEKEAKANWQPLHKVASGGELSRLMLSIKSLVAKNMDMPTMIFDEIDSGISGEAAKQVGFILKDLAVSRQIICITHQPQIAGKADAHYFVYKEKGTKGISTNIKQLNVEERITAIAQMMSGEKPTAAALENAKEMVQG